MREPTLLTLIYSLKSWGSYSHPNLQTFDLNAGSQLKACWDDEDELKVTEGLKFNLYQFPASSTQALINK